MCENAETGRISKSVNVYPCPCLRLHREQDGEKDIIHTCNLLCRGREREEMERDTKGQRLCLSPKIVGEGNSYLIRLIE